MSERGVFAVARGIFDHPMFASDDPFTEREAWIWMIGEAAWKPTRVRVGAAIILLARGELSHSIRFLAKKWRWHPAKVQRFLKRLKTETAIGTRVDTGVTVITICKYNEYQRVSLPTDTPGDTPTDTAAIQQRYREEDIEDIKEDTSSLRSDVTRARDLRREFDQTFWPAYRHKVGKAAALKSFITARRKASLDEIMAGLSRYIAAKPPDREWCNPTTFLNQERWKDEPATVSPSSRGPPPGNPFARKLRRMMEARNGQGPEQDDTPTLDLEAEADEPGSSSGVEHLVQPGGRRDD